MIDVIIPVYNSRATLPRALASICIQTIREKAKVLIIDDNSTVGYDDIIDDFKDYIDINILKIPENKGSGYARQYGLDNSYSDYVIFLDSDDVFYNKYAFSVLYYAIDENNLDVLITKEVDESLKTSKINNKTIHGKIYRRSYLNDKDIRFTDKRYSEDTTFNLLAVNLTNNKMTFENETTYIYLDNPDSLVHDSSNDKERINDYIYSICTTAKRLKKEKCDNFIIAQLVCEAYVYLFIQLKINESLNAKTIYKNIKKIDSLFDKYFIYLDEEYLKNKIVEKSDCGYILIDNIMVEFKSFVRMIKGEK